MYTCWQASVSCVLPFNGAGCMAWRAQAISSIGELHAGEEERFFQILVMILGNGSIKVGVKLNQIFGTKISHLKPVGSIASGGEGKRSRALENCLVLAFCLHIVKVYSTQPLHVYFHESRRGNSEEVEGKWEWKGKGQGEV